MNEPRMVGGGEKDVVASLVSVIIPTYRRWDHVLATARDNPAQDYSAIEVIVVDQNMEWPDNLGTASAGG